MAKKKVYHVVHRDDGWIVKGEGAKRATSVHSTQREAVNRARELARGRGGEMVIHGRDGKIRSRDAYGSDPSPPRDRMIQRFGRASRDTAPEEEAHSEQPSIDVWIDPGTASSADLAEFYTALSELHRAHGGVGIDFRDDDTKVYSLEEVSS